MQGQVAVITGAGRGIGSATAEALAREGCAVVLVARDAEAIGEAADRITSANGCALAVPADVCSSESVQGMVRSTVDRFGRIDALVTCAAAGPVAGPSEELPLEDWQRVIDTDLTGTFLTCQAVGRVMLEHRFGRIVNVSSFHTVATYPGRAAYVAAKAGVTGLTRALAVDWAGRGICVNAVAPGPVRTPRTEWFLSGDPSAEAGMLGRTPAGRLGETGDVVAAILFLCSRQAGFVNGETLVVDGGWTKSAWWGSYAEGPR